MEETEAKNQADIKILASKIKNIQQENSELKSKITDLNNELETNEGALVAAKSTNLSLGGE